MDYIMLSFLILITVICSGANADCAADLQKNSEYTKCFNQFMEWQNGASGSDTPTDTMCTADVKTKIGCLLNFIVQCPQIVENMQGPDGRSFSIPRIDLSKLTGDNPLETICATAMHERKYGWTHCFTGPELVQMGEMQHEQDLNDTVTHTNNLPGYFTPSNNAYIYNMTTNGTYDYYDYYDSYNGYYDTASNDLVPNHYSKFLSLVYIACGDLKSGIDCAITGLEEGGFSMEPLVRTMPFANIKMFMKKQCPAVTADFKWCVGETLAKKEFIECYKNATEMYKTPKMRKSCAMYLANKDCIVDTVQGDCGKPTALWLIKNSPKIVDTGLPTYCEETPRSKIVGYSESMLLMASVGVPLMVAIVSYSSVM